VPSILILQVEVFWVVMLCSVVVGYQHFKGPCYFHLQDEVTRMGKNSIDTGLDCRGAADAATQ